MSLATIHVVDDDASVREALGMLFRFEGFEVRTYASGRDFLDCMPQGEGCIVLDMRLGDMSGQDVLELLGRRGNRLPVLILTAYGDIPATVKAMRAGAFDFFTKSNDPGTLVTRVKELVAESRSAAASVDDNWYARGLATLSPRQREVFGLAMQGLDNQAIATAMALSPRTVEAHRSAIARKFEVDSLAEVFRRVATGPGASKA